MEYKTKTIIWEDNNEPPKNYLWVKSDGKVYEFNYTDRKWEESKSISVNGENNKTTKSIYDMTWQELVDLYISQDFREFTQTTSEFDFIAPDYLFMQSTKNNPAIAVRTINELAEIISREGDLPLEEARGNAIRMISGLNAGFLEKQNAQIDTIDPFGDPIQIYKQIVTHISVFDSGGPGVSNTFTYCPFVVKTRNARYITWKQYYINGISLWGETDELQ